MLSINYSDEIFALTDTHNPHFGRFTHIWTKEQFQSKSGVDPSAYLHVVYEPERNDYAVVMASDPSVVLTFDTPIEHPAVNWIHNHRVALLGEAEAAHAARIGYVWNGETYIPEKEAMDLETLREARISELNQRTLEYATTILSLSNLATAAGLDVSSQANTRLGQIRNWLHAERDTINGFSSHSELLNYHISTFDDNAEGDINFVVNQL